MRSRVFLLMVMTGVATAEVIYHPSTLWLAHDGSDGIYCMVNLRAISVAARAWRADHGQFPPGFEAITNDLTSPAQLCCPANHRAPCPQSFSEMNWNELDYEWLEGFDPYDEQSVFVQCRIHGNVVRINGLAERLFGFRNGWPAAIAGPMYVSATPGETVRFEVRLAPTVLQPVRLQWEQAQITRHTNVTFVENLMWPGGGFWQTNVRSEVQGTAITGAQDSVYTISSVSFSDPIWYRVSMSNAMGRALSSVVRLQVLSELANPRTNEPTARALCISRLASIRLGAQLWANDRGRLPGSFAELTNRYGSPLLGWPLILYCPWDTNRAPVVEWEDVDFGDVSYELTQPTPSLEDIHARFCRCKVHGFYVEAGGGVVTNEGPPIISRHPLSQTVYVGFTASLYVDVRGPGPFTSQWRKDGIDLIGETEGRYLISPAEARHAGRYDVVVGNAFGTVTSSNAVLIVAAPLILRDSRITAAGLFECTVLGPVDYRHVIECSSDLIFWAPVATNVTSANGISIFQAPVDSGRKFYRGSP